MSFSRPGWKSPPLSPLSPELDRRALAGEHPGVSARVVSDHQAALTLDITAGVAGAIQVAEFYFPGWRGWLDGDPVSLRAGRSTGMIELDVPAGQHRLELALRGHTRAHAGRMA